MALLTCPECSGPVSDVAATCPKCGRPMAGSTAPAPVVAANRPTRPVFKILVFVFFGIPLIALVGSSIMKTDPGPAPVLSAAQPALAALRATVPAVVSPAFGDIPDGVYEVGAALAPGIYRVGTYWERKDRNQSTLDNDLTQGCPSILIVRPTDAYVEIKGGALEASKIAIDPIERRCTSGTFLVGKDIAPGRYKLRAETNTAYWERLDAKLGTIANDLGSGDRIVVVRAADFAVKTSGATIERM
jgi:hypothetical protein